MVNAGASVVLTAGAASKRRNRLGVEIRPGSESRANARKVPWEHERSDRLPPREKEPEWCGETGRPTPRRSGRDPRNPRRAKEAGVKEVTLVRRKTKSERTSSRKS
jgi:hypothetical protein